MAPGLLSGHPDLLPLHELLPLLPLELLQQNRQPRLRLSALRPGLSLHGSTCFIILANCGDRGGGAAANAHRGEQGNHGTCVPQRSSNADIQGYCKYRNLFMMASYFMVFYLSTMYDTNDSGVPLPQFRAASKYSHRCRSSPAFLPSPSPSSTSSATAPKTTTSSTNPSNPL